MNVPVFAAGFLEVQFAMVSILLNLIDFTQRYSMAASSLCEFASKVTCRYQPQAKRDAGSGPLALRRRIYFSSNFSCFAESRIAAIDHNPCGQTSWSIGGGALSMIENCSPYNNRSSN